MFLSAEWRDLVMLNYVVDPSLLNGYVPDGTLLDSFEGNTYMSLVAFRFCQTRLFGWLPVPFHSNFDEVNLRFYVRRQASGEERRGVVFIAEFVPKALIASTARIVYGENYRRAEMRRAITVDGDARTIGFQWRVGNEWCRLRVRTDSAAAHPQQGSLEQFITEHYWGYSAKKSGRSLEYRVSHVPWRVWKTCEASFEGDSSALYGPVLSAVLLRRPDSAFVADGSEVEVFHGTEIGSSPPNRN